SMFSLLYYDLMITLYTYTRSDNLNESRTNFIAPSPASIMHLLTIICLLSSTLVGFTNGLFLYGDNPFPTERDLSGDDSGLVRRVDDYEHYYGNLWTLNMAFFVQCLDICRGNHGIPANEIRGHTNELKGCILKCETEVGEEGIGDVYFRQWRGRHWDFPPEMMARSSERYRETVWSQASG
ncbi:hypothetical protein F5B20DRAFT_520630, partial [Whalleya microplaca]